MSTSVGTGIACPNCALTNSGVRDSRPCLRNTRIRRRRCCEDCGFRFTTYEIVKPEVFSVITPRGVVAPLKSRIEEVGKMVSVLVTNALLSAAFAIDEPDEDDDG